MNKRAQIIELNDRLRTTFKGGRVQMTPAVYNLDPQLRGRALWTMAKCTKFDDRSEHDWGVMIFAGYAFEWRIEYRAKDGNGISPDPTDPNKTFRAYSLRHSRHTRRAMIELPNPPRAAIVRVPCPRLFFRLFA